MDKLIEQIDKLYRNGKVEEAMATFYYLLKIFLKFNVTDDSKKKNLINLLAWTNTFSQLLEKDGNYLKSYNLYADALLLAQKKEISELIVPFSKKSAELYAYVLNLTPATTTLKKSKEYEAYLGTLSYLTDALYYTKQDKRECEKNISKLLESYNSNLLKMSIKISLYPNKTRAEIQQAFTDILSWSKKGLAQRQPSLYRKLLSTLLEDLLSVSIEDEHKNRIRLQLLESYAQLNEILCHQFDLTPYWQRYINRLDIYRKEFFNDFSATKRMTDIYLLQQNFSEKCCYLLSDILKDSIYFMSWKTPCRHAVAAVGSMSRKDMKPYSDVELVVLIEDKKYVEYFRKLIKFLNLILFSYGESGSRPGLHLDSLQLTLAELITTPDGFIEYIRLAKEDTLAYSSLNIKFICGDEQIFNQSCLLVKKKTDPKLNQISQKLALSCINYNIQLYRKENLKDISNDNFNVKERFLTPVIMTLMGLSWYQDLAESGFVAVLESLKKTKLRDVICEIENAIAFLQCLRTQMQEESKCQNDILDVNLDGKKLTKSNIFNLQSNEQSLLERLQDVKKCLDSFINVVENSLLANDIHNLTKSEEVDSEQHSKSSFKEVSIKHKESNMQESSCINVNDIIKLGLDFGTSSISNWVRNQYEERLRQNVPITGPFAPIGIGHRDTNHPNHKLNVFMETIAEYAAEQGRLFAERKAIELKEGLMNKEEESTASPKEQAADVILGAIDAIHDELHKMLSDDTNSNDEDVQQRNELIRQFKESCEKSYIRPANNAFAYLEKKQKSRLYDLNKGKMESEFSTIARTCIEKEQSANNTLLTYCNNTIRGNESARFSMLQSRIQHYLTGNLNQVFMICDVTPAGYRSEEIVIEMKFLDWLKKVVDTYGGTPEKKDTLIKLKEEIVKVFSIDTSYNFSPNIFKDATEKVSRHETEIQKIKNKEWYRSLNPVILNLLPRIKNHILIMEKIFEEDCKLLEMILKNNLSTNTGKNINQHFSKIKYEFKLDAAKKEGKHIDLAGTSPEFMLTTTPIEITNAVIKKMKELRESGEEDKLGVLSNNLKNFMEFHIKNNEFYRNRMQVSQLNSFLSNKSGSPIYNQPQPATSNSAQAQLVLDTNLQNEVGDNREFNNHG